MYRPLKFLVLFLGVFAFLSIPSGAATRAKFSGLILVDTRQMLLTHPLFGKFDPKTRRFIGTRSEPTNGLAGRRMIKAELDSNLKAFESFKKVWADRLQNTAGSQRKKLEAIFLKEKNKKEAEISELRQRYYAVASIPGREGLTEPGSIVSQVFSISSDIRDVLVRLRNRYKAESVIDVSSLLPPESEKYDIEIVQSNAMAVLYAGRAYKGNMNEWVTETRKYWMNHGNLWNPFIIGTEDRRKEAVEELERVTRGKY